MRSIAEIKAELRQAESREARNKIACMSCDGEGWICDTTYIRAGGEWQPCGGCHGSGLPRERVAEIVKAAFDPFRRPRP